MWQACGVDPVVDAGILENRSRMVFVEPNAPLECWEGEVADPVPGGVLIRTSIAGVCGTDAHRLDGDVP